MADYTMFAEIANENTTTEVMDLSADYVSWVWQLIKRQPMSASRIKQPVKGMATPATWVGANRRKEYVAYTIGKQYLVAAEIAQVTAVDENDFEDVSIDVVELMQTYGAESILRGLDFTIGQGDNSSEFPWIADYKAIVPGATAVGNTVVATGNAAVDAKAVAAKLASNGFRTGAFVVAGDVSLLWGITAGDLNNTPALTGDTPETYRLWGKPVVFVEDGAFGPDVTVVALDLRHFTLGVRKDITFKNSDVATAIAAATGANGTLRPEDIISAFQDDMVLFRVMARFGFAHAGDATHYPAAIAVATESA